MFIKTIVKTDKKTEKRYNYYRLCESYRIGNKTRHRSIVSMGRLDGIETREDKKLLADTIEALIQGEGRLAFFDVGPDITRHAKEFAKRIKDEKLLDIHPKTTTPEYSNIGPDHQEVDLNSIRHEEVREIGAEWLCKQALEQLELQGLLTGSCRFSETSAAMAMMHITSRAVFPASGHKTARWIKDNSAVASLFNIPIDKVNRFKLYAASNSLYKQKTAIEKGLSAKTNELFDLQDKIIFYDLTSASWRIEGRKAGSKIARYGRSKEKRSDAKLVAMVAVINAEGFLKYSRIYQGNISDNKTLGKTISELSAHTPQTARKPVIVMDAGIMIEDNAKMLKQQGYDYICVNRTKLKDYTAINPEQENITIYDKNKNPIELRYVAKKDCPDNYLYVRSQQKATDITGVKNPVQPKQGEGIYFIRTNLSEKDENTIWTIYNTLTEIEATFRCLKTDLALRPVFHKYDENIESHLFLGLLAYQVVATIRYQLKAKDIHHDWRNIVRIMNTQKEVITTIEHKKGKTIRIKKCSVPSVEAKQIYEALGYKTVPYYMKKSVLPEI